MYLFRSTNNTYDGNILQIFGEEDATETLPTLQTLYEKSMVFSDIKFTKVCNKFMTIMLLC